MAVLCYSIVFCRLFFADFTTVNTYRRSVRDVLYGGQRSRHQADLTHMFSQPFSFRCPDFFSSVTILMYHDGPYGFLTPILRFIVSESTKKVPLRIIRHCCLSSEGDCVTEQCPYVCRRRNDRSLCLARAPRL
ncbi:hypothetical protein LZ32DRAFT_134034 [Colletotrichum eremochloae]|nr:hypothetical protein LZ32DRAFT_134034 [Colletotrichum eremochloae]